MKRAVLVTFFLLIAAPWVWGQFCDCEVPASVRTTRLRNADRALDRAVSSEAEIVAKHFPFGLPTPPADASNESMMLQSEWVTWYDTDLRVPLWVGYQLTKAEARRKRYPRQDCFRRDKRLTDQTASFCEDYDEPLYDRGHMVPANDSKRNQAMMDNSFLFSNMTPQRGNFNRKIWEALESQVNAWAEQVGVFVITGAIFDRNNDGTRDADVDALWMSPRRRVAIPTHFYKIVFHVRTSGEYDTISFLLPHNNRTIRNKARYLKSKIAAIDDIENVTGIDFFPDMDTDREEQVEEARAESLERWVTK